MSAGIFLAGVVFVLVLQRLEIMVLNCGAAKRRRRRPDVLAGLNANEPVWHLPTTPMPPAVDADDLEVWAEHLLLEHRRGRHALPSQPRLAITSGDAS